MEDANKKVSNKRLRRYNRHRNRVSTLSTWIQNKCCKCGRFLKKHQKKWCHNCQIIIRHLQREKYNNSLKGKETKHSWYMRNNYGSK